ncbi:MAG: efflux RND transporter permease subunit, partial [Terriglobales bacterium]
MIAFALRRPYTVLALTAAVVLGAVLAWVRLPVDVFPRLDLPVIYVAQPFGGMAPSQMEGFLVNYYEANFLYLSGLQHVESRSIQNVALIKLSFQPGTDMNAAVAETVSYAERSRAYMPPNTVAPFIMRFDADSVPVGDLVFSSPQRSQAELDDFAQVRVRPILARLAGVAAPPPFGGNPRTVVISLQAGPMASHGLSPDDVLKAVVSGNTVLPAGNLRVGEFNRMVELNTVAAHYQELLALPLRTGSGPTLFLRDVATINTESDVVSGYAELNGRRVVYIPVAKRSGASTLASVGEVKDALPAMREQVPPDVGIAFQFDQSLYVREALRSLLLEGLSGALLTALAVWLFLRDGRSSAIVILIIPLSLLAAILGLWISGQTINIMTLGGLALAVGILVDEVTVVIENLHTHLGQGKPLARAALDSGREVLAPSLLAMLSVVAVFLPSFLMVGVGRSLFVPLALAVGFAMAASWLFSTLLAPILAIWWLRGSHGSTHGGLQRLRAAVGGWLASLLPHRRATLAAYLLGSIVLVLGLGQVVGTDIFPATDTGQFQMRLRLPTGTRLRLTEENYLKALAIVEREA